ncbi:MAG: 4Fe-4S ferredoxin [Bacteroidetes bacterium GWF2_42_66]|nr:MAG: 4Fe-4S ferredoxin [Bacteroidetes bacterium GWA2_42_15]OFY03013.1 MAG: 4Fe-4S ferredoxin [Bacteroidetes bacterium GWE2_42_39]OFY43265.1 MAG: 4Fe-4S ferredoxin [Bacteroidetes bacterium GWF2_42_66]HAZ04568.1 4Fe-4S ferredoxin [Marinilabiliales bacterium]HBL77276.1 4Fe-4S ferredoxin [Prolixibacteraceae bacterium]
MAYHITSNCVACGDCVYLFQCPVGAIIEDEIYRIEATLCTDCGSCIDVCLVDAIKPGDNSLIA